MQQMRNIAPIADIDLFPCIVNRRVFIRRVLQLDDAQRHSVDKKKNIRAAGLRLPVVGVFHGELINRAEDIFLRILKLNQIDHSGKSRLRGELNSVHHPVVHLMQCGKITFRTRKAHGVHDLLNLIRGQIRVGSVQEKLHVISV